MQSLLSVPMPMLMSWLYARGSSLPWALCAVLSAISAALFAMLSKGEIAEVARHKVRTAFCAQSFQSGQTRSGQTRTPSLGQGKTSWPR